MTTPLSSKLSPPLLLRLTPAACRLFATTSVAAATTTAGDPEVVTISEPLKPKPRPNGSRRATTRDKRVGLDVHQMKLNWLDSLSCPFPDNCRSRASEVSECGSVVSGWVIGVDPDISGALAVLKPDNSSEVFDSPHVKVLVGKRVRKRLDVKSIIKLLQNVDAPIGTTVYIEQSIPYPQDGMVEWRIWIWTMDRDPGCLGIFCCSDSILIVEE